jgi:hypothetical protein
MKTLSLIAILALSVNAQGLISADGNRWKHFAIGKPANGKKFDLYVKLPIGGNRKIRKLTVKAWDGPESTVEVNCKKGLLHANDEEWVKPQPGTVGHALIKWACKK